MCGQAAYQMINRANLVLSKAPGVTDNVASETDWLAKLNF